MDSGVYMLKKGKTIFVILMLLTTTIILINPENETKIVSATPSFETYGGAEINYNWIKVKLEDFGDVIDTDDRGREFGTNGEDKSNLLLSNWSNDIGLESVKIDPIDTRWLRVDVCHLAQWVLWENFLGNLRSKREFDSDDYYLNISVYDENWEVIDGRNLSYLECFNFMKAGVTNRHNVSFSNITIQEDFNDSKNAEEHIALFNESWEDPFSWCFLDPIRRVKAPKNFRAFILVNDDADTYFMGPSINDHLFTLGRWSTAGFSVNGSTGSWIRANLANQSRHVKADLKNHWQYNRSTTENVMGQINGTDRNNVSIICAHSDAWWSEGTIDEGLETILSLYIGKYIIDNNLTPKHDIKIVAFTGEEIGFRGVKHYLKKYVLGPCGENIQYIFNPGNFGHSDVSFSDGKDIDFEICTSEADSEFRRAIENITNAFRYEEATGINVEFPFEFGREDSFIFDKVGKGEHIAQFGRGPYQEYHRGNEQHTGGDNMTVLNDTLAEIECSLVTTIALHFLIENERDIDLYTYSLVDSDNDGLNDTVNVAVNLTAAIPTWGYVNLSLEDSQGLSIVNETSLLQAFNQTQNQTYSSHIQLPPNATSGEYKLNITLLNFINRTIEDNCSVFVELNPLGHPVADFTSERGLGKQVNFTNTSYIPPGLYVTNFSWTFGDGNISYLEDPQHTYSCAGRMYDVSLTITTNDSQMNTTSRSIALPAYAPSAQCQDAGEWHYVDEAFNLETQCSDYDGSIVEYDYNWGDGTSTSTSSSTVPSHSYSEGGFYTVSLTVTDDDNISTTDYTTVNVADIYIDDSYSRDSPSRGWWRSIDDGLQNASTGDILYIHPFSNQPFY